MTTTTMARAADLRPTRTITLARGWVDPETLNMHRVVVVRQQTIGDELAGERAMRELAREAPGSAGRLLADADTGLDVLILSRCILSWEGIAAFSYNHLLALTRRDYLAIKKAVNDLDEEGLAGALATAEQDKAAGTTDPK
jgi:phage FluMu protein gp41